MSELLSTVRRSQISYDRDFEQRSAQTGFYEDVSLHDSWLPKLSEEVRPFIIPGMKSLELGCGRLFSFSLVLSLLGLQTYGIEARPESVAIASKIISELEANDLIRRGSIQVELGNFFPRDYTTSDQIRWDKWIDGPNTLDGIDPYKRMGLSLADFDAIAVYQYYNNRNETLKLAAERCRSYALVISVGRVEVPAPNLSLIHHSESTLTPDFNFYSVD